MRLSEHFTLEELTVSQEGARLGIANQPGQMEMDNIARYLVPGLEQVRLFLKQPMLVSSGLRCAEINACVGGAMTRESLQQLAAASKLERVVMACQHRLEIDQVDRSDSAHMRGLAADFTSPKYGPPILVARALFSSGIPFDQLIYEYGSWVHVGFGPVPRRQVLTKLHGQPYRDGLHES